MPAKENSLMGEIVAQNNITKGPPCTFVSVLASLTPDDRDGLKEALGNPEIRNTAIRRALVGRGFQISEYTVSRHRKGECLCEPE